MIRELAGRLMRHPAVAYHEHRVREEVETICSEHGLNFRRDRFGNVIVSLRTAARMRPMVLAAHMDHPGFEMVRGHGDGELLARFRGGLAEGYFRAGIRLRLMPGVVPAKLGPTQGADKIFRVEPRKQVTERPRFAVWELEDFAVRGGRIIGRACDDLIGVASALAVMIELKRRRARVHVMAVISRAEEVGFHGALAVAANGVIPKNAMVISLETSRELPGVKMGCGVILRVGDRMSVFDSDATRFLAEVGVELRDRTRRFRFQRALMAGGTCEATAYQQYGFQTAGVCVALGNYHNGGPGNRVRAEYVSEADASGMVELLVASAEGMGRFKELVGELPKRLEKMRREAEGMLKRSAE